MSESPKPVVHYGQPPQVWLAGKIYHGRVQPLQHHRITCSAERHRTNRCLWPSYEDPKRARLAAPASQLQGLAQSRTPRLGNRQGRKWQVQCSPHTTPLNPSLAHGNTSIGTLVTAVVDDLLAVQRQVVQRVVAAPNFQQQYVYHCIQFVGQAGSTCTRGDLGKTFHRSHTTMMPSLCPGSQQAKLGTALPERELAPGLSCPHHHRARHQPSAAAECPGSPADHAGTAGWSPLACANPAAATAARCRLANSTTTLASH